MFYFEFPVALIVDSYIILCYIQFPFSGHLCLILQLQAGAFDVCGMLVVLCTVLPCNIYGSLTGKCCR